MYKNQILKISLILVILIFSATLVFVGQKYNALPKTKAQVQQAPVEIAAVGDSATSQDQINPEKQPEVAVVDGPQIGATIEEAQASVPTGPRSKDPKIALIEARIYAKPQITEGKYIDISLSHQNMVLFENGVFVDSYLVSTGKASMPTPPGTYHIQNKVPRAYSKEFGLYMPWWMALVPSGSFGIHELPEWPGGYKEGANHLGVPVSHGCVRLGVGPAKRVYDWADIGTTVIVHK